jgi:RimJ/RimL family protein N-acetyltransferase
VIIAASWSASATRRSDNPGRPIEAVGAACNLYLAHDAIGRGLGTRLYQALLDRLADCGRHVAIGGIALPNQASVSMHEKLGFRKVAHFCEVGFKFGRWIDTAYWQRMLAVDATMPGPPSIGSDASV